jgi:hypothetical protein
MLRQAYSDWEVFSFRAFSEATLKLGLLAVKIGY